MFDVHPQSIHEIRIGETVYRLRSLLIANYYPRLQGAVGELVVTESNLKILGKGKNFEEGLHDWKLQFHSLFQTLIAKRPCELTEDEKIEWDRIDLLVDISTYRRETPYRIQQIGIVSQRRPTAHEPRPLPNRIRWESGKEEAIQLELAPPEFAAFHAGKRFRAVVLRNAIMDRLIKILAVTPLQALPNNNECDDLWGSFPSS